MKKCISLGIIVCLFALSACSKDGANDGVDFSMETKGALTESTTDAAADVIASTVVLKDEGNANPISSNIFCADPTAIEYEGKLYIYGTNDQQQYDAVDGVGDNTYEKIKSFVIYSTEDMVNWTYEGLIDVGSIAPWIINSWAPSIVSRVEDDGLTHFYLYFSNNGLGVGVLTSTSPTGPWSDPLGEPFISTETEGLENCPNPFDPGVCIDDNGTGWITFGGGTNASNTYISGVSKIAKLGTDMLSLDSDFSQIPAPYFFEASELNYINGTYVYTFNTNWDTRDEWTYSGEAPSLCSMAYMTSRNPLDSNSWTYQGEYFLNPGDVGMKTCNNHTHFFEYEGEYYIASHSMALNTENPYRSIFVDKLSIDEKTLEIQTTGGSLEGVTQIKAFNPYSVNKGTSICTSAEIGYDYDEENVPTVRSLNTGSWFNIKKADFSSEADRFYATLKGTGTIEVRLDSKDGEAVTEINVDSEDWITMYDVLDEQITGEHDLYFVFSNADICLDEWQFAN